MNKFFLLALFALIAVVAAAPADPKPEEEFAVGEPHEQDKRAIYYRSGYPGYRFLSGYDYPAYRYGLRSLTYPEISPLTYPYYGRYII